MSATFDTSMFANYFAMPIAGKLENAPVVNIEGKVYDVQEIYAPDVSHLGQVRMQFLFFNYYWFSLTNNQTTLYVVSHLPVFSWFSTRS